MAKDIKRGAPYGNKNAVGNKGGAPIGNQNAVGNKGGGAPKGNTNAMKHGLYAKAYWHNLYRLYKAMKKKERRECPMAKGSKEEGQD